MRLTTRPMWVDRRSTRRTSSSAPQITLRTRISRPLKCTRTQPWTGGRGADGAWAGDRCEWDWGSGGLDEQEWSSFMNHHLIQLPPTDTKPDNNNNKTKM